MNLTTLRGYWTISDLLPGDRFRFHYYPTDKLSPESYLYLGNGWYRDKQNKRWRTSRRTAVRLVNADD